MKLGIVGKGGVGKTTISALIAEAYASRGKRVVAIDTDSNPNLGVSLGLAFADAEAMPVVPRSVASGPGAGLDGAELLATYGTQTPAGVTVLSAMRVDQAAAGCTCGSHAAVRSMLRDVLDDEADVTIVDMEAGLEHLSRSGGTLAYADVLLMVMEPSRKSVMTAARTVALADELGIPRCLGVGNKARPDDAAFFAEACAASGVEVAAVIPLDAAIPAADRAGSGVVDAAADDARAAISELVDRLEALSLVADHE
ncbi:MAG: AAA family ATPase [Acidimicrobiia bacterium]|nr:AAA family ATPase [Acidimicrobiia bacterium]MBA3803797.1 AAA family ATPase [Acidimicrobiia bacterium]